MNNTAVSDKKVFLVLGMARAGTSVIAQSLKVFDAHLVSSSTQSDVAKEKDIFSRMSSSIFVRLGVSSEGLQVIAAEDLYSEIWDSLIIKAQDALNQQFIRHNRLVFNDSATARVLPFWHRVFKKVNIETYSVISLRHPIVAARSYQNLTGVDIETGLLLWSVDMLQVIEASQGSRRIVVAYELMLREPLKQLDRIASAFQLEKVDESKAQVLINEVLDDKLHRDVALDHKIDLTASANVAALCMEIYECLLRVAKDEIKLDGPEFVDRWSAIKAEYTSLYPMYCYVDRLLERRKKLQQKLSSVHHSWSWKLLTPLRWVDDYLRLRRRKKHLIRRAVTDHA